MIRHPSDCHGREAEIVPDTSEVGPQGLPKLSRDQIAPVFGTENAMYGIGCVGVGHGAVP